MNTHKITIPFLITGILFAAGIFYFQGVILLVFMATLLALAIHVPADFLIQKGLKEPLALIITILGAIAVIFGIILVIVPALYQGINELTQVIPASVAELSGVYSNLQSQYGLLPDINSVIPETDDGSGIIKSVTDALFSSLGNVGALLTNALIVLLIAIFFLIDPYQYKKVFLSLVPKKHREHAKEISSSLKHNLQSWIKTLGLSISITFVLVWLALTLIGFPYAFVIALIAGLATFIPNVGAIVPIVPIIIFGITATNPIVTLWATIIYVAIQLTESNIITPSLMKASLNILPAGILIFQIIAAQVFGVLGVLLSVPILVVIIVLVKELHVKKI